MTEQQPSKEKRDAEVIRLYELGIMVKNIAKMLHITDSTIRKLLERRGIPKHRKRCQKFGRVQMMRISKQDTED